MWMIYFLLGVAFGSIAMKILTQSKFIGTMHVLKEDDNEHFQCYMTIKKEEDITSLKNNSVVTLEVKTGFDSQK